MEVALSVGASASAGAYADSVDSLSPRSRGGESWDEPLAAAPATAAPATAATASVAPKLRLMCSYGGHIVPRPHDKALCYLGGETRIVAVDRHATLADLHARLSRSLLGGRPFSLKYQLPSEDLDSLISVATDEDLDNMVEEYDRVAAASSSGAGARQSRLRLFLFPAKAEPDAGLPSSASSSIAAGGSLLDDSSKSENWFVDALNGAMPLLGRNHSSADSVNCLLGLEDSYPSPNGAAGGGPTEAEGGQLLFPRRDSSGKLAGGGRHGAQDVQSMPDSPMLETASSFGSASSAPSLSSLPPIRVRPEDADPRAAVDTTGVEEQFAQMNISGQQQKPPLDVEGFKHHLQHFPPPPPPDSISPIALAATDAAGETPTSLPPTENPKPSALLSSSSDDKSPQGGIWRSPPQQPQHQQQQQQQQHQQQEQQGVGNSKVLDLPMSGEAFSRPVYCQERPSKASDLQQQETHFSDLSYRFPMHVTEQGYLLHQPSLLQPTMRAVEQLQQQPLQQQAQQQQSAVSHLATHHHPTGPVLPIPSYYNQMLIHPQQQLPQVATHPYRPQVPLYFLPVHHSSAYNLPVQPKLGDSVATAPVPSTSKPTIPPPSSVLPPHVAPVGAPPVLQQPPQPTKLIHLDQSHQYVGYHPRQHPASQSAASTPAAAGYGYDYVDAVHAFQMYYAPASSTALPPQYQMMSAGAVTAEPPLALQQRTDGKQASPS